MSNHIDILAIACDKGWCGKCVHWILHSAIWHSQRWYILSTWHIRSTSEYIWQSLLVEATRDVEHLKCMCSNAKEEILEPSSTQKGPGHSKSNANDGGALKKQQPNHLQGKLGGRISMLYVVQT